MQSSIPGISLSALRNRGWLRGHCLKHGLQNGSGLILSSLWNGTIRDALNRLWANGKRLKTGRSAAGVGYLPG